MMKKYIALFALVVGHTTLHAEVDSPLNLESSNSLLGENYVNVNSPSSFSRSSSRLSLTSPGDDTGRSTPEATEVAKDVVLVENASSTPVVLEAAPEVLTSKALIEQSSSSPELQALEKEVLANAGLNASETQQKSTRAERDAAVAKVKSKQSTLSARAAARQTAAVARQAAEIITGAFAGMDAWMSRDAFVSFVKPNSYSAQEYKEFLPEEQERYDVEKFLGGKLDEYGKIMFDNSVEAQNKLKINTAERYMNDALTTIGKRINASSMKPIADKFNQALKSFATGSNIDNVVLRSIVDSVKIVLMVPVKVAVHAGTYGTGIALWTAGGAGAGLGAGINRTARWMSQTNIRNQKTGNISMVEVAKAIPITIAKGLVGVVGTPLLAAYGAVEGSVIGEELGIKYGKQIAGNRLFSLNKNYEQTPDKRKARAEERAIEKLNKKSAAKEIAEDKAHIRELSAKQRQNLYARSQAAINNPNNKPAPLAKVVFHK